jgi:hypothetical protein
MDMTAAVARTPLAAPHSSLAEHNPNTDRTQPVTVPDAPFVPPARLYQVPSDLPPVPVALGRTTPPWTQTDWANMPDRPASHRTRWLILTIVLAALLAAAAAGYVLFVR